MSNQVWMDQEGLHGLSPTELDETYLRVHRHLLGMMRREIVSRLSKCRYCSEVAYWLHTETGPYMTSDFYCDGHRPPEECVEINKPARAILKTLEGI